MNPVKLVMMALTEGRARPSGIGTAYAGGSPERSRFTLAEFSGPKNTPVFSPAAPGSFALTFAQKAPESDCHGSAGTAGPGSPKIAAAAAIVE